LIKRPKIYITLFAIVYIAFFVTIVWLGNSIEEIGAMTRFVENVLSKDTTFTSRTDIWSNAVYKIQQSPWIGFGVQNVEWNMRYLDGSGPHNLWLMLLLQGGIILCGAFIYNVLFIIRNTFKDQTPSSILGAVSICVFFIMSLFEAYNLVQTFLLLQLIYYSPLLKANPIEGKD
jgi:O-antigen ligase